MNYAFLIAAGVSAFALVLHLMLGRVRPVAEPVSSAEDQASLMAAAWFGRHFQSFVLAIMAAAFAHAARETDARDVVMWLSVLALLAAALKFGMGVYSAAPRFDVREWGLMALAAIVALIGLAV